MGGARNHVRGGQLVKELDLVSASCRMRRRGWSLGGPAAVGCELASGGSGVVLKMCVRSVDAAHELPFKEDALVQPQWLIITLLGT